MFAIKDDPLATSQTMPQTYIDKKKNLQQQK
jgi:hypothetical protein